MHPMQLLNPALLRKANPSATCLHFLVSLGNEIPILYRNWWHVQLPKQIYRHRFYQCHGILLCPGKNRQQKIVVHTPNVSPL